jgi:uncharacterized membrane protein required for colicin V production
MEKKAYIATCTIVAFLLFGTGGFLIIEGTNWLVRIMGVVIGFCGIFMVVGMYGTLRGITKEKLAGRMKIRCQITDLQKGMVPPQE